MPFDCSSKIWIQMNGQIGVRAVSYTNALSLWYFWTKSFNLFGKRWRTSSEEIRICFQAEGFNQPNRTNIDPTILLCSSILFLLAENDLQFTSDSSNDDRWTVIEPLDESYTKQLDLSRIIPLQSIIGGNSFCPKFSCPAFCLVGKHPKWCLNECAQYLLPSISKLNTSKVRDQTRPASRLVLMTGIVPVECCWAEEVPCRNCF